MFGKGMIYKDASTKELLCLNWLGPFFIFYINNTYCAFFDYGTLNIFKMLVRLLFDFTCSFVFMISIYSDVKLFKLFLYVSAHLCLLVGGWTQSHQDDGGTPADGDIRRKWEDLKSRGHHA